MSLKMKSVPQCAPMGHSAFLNEKCAKRGSILTSLSLVAEWTYPNGLKASHFVYLGWAKMALKWLKRVLCVTRMTKLTHPRESGTKSDVLAS